ncbi:probable peptidyl-tRNA hydrolase 2 [Eupeodes corollae]|uniref:probable peptidyl-tRNA hydrolase 2 n=1 Tax=Eupeodes corollae TaxID=290404 RepID=UPI002490FCC2|nr:probable peptidyl-tRNA hydrolase 2 [Eupeodes corollae]
MMGGDGKLVDTTQVINGLAVLLSFFVGYKYAIKKHITEAGDDKDGCSKDEASSAGAMSFSDYSDNYKMFIVVRNDLKMGKGNIGSKCGHEAVGAYQKSMRHKPNLERLWERTGCAKIALKVESERELQTIRRSAEANGLVCCVIHNAGRTQIEPSSKTVLAIGPAASSDIDKLTGHLKLL